jgi:hypothetical protein
MFAFAKVFEKMFLFAKIFVFTKFSFVQKCAFLQVFMKNFGSGDGFCGKFGFRRKL